jgi:hypothetical protein
MTTKKPVLAPDEVQELVLEIFGDSLHASVRPPERRSAHG